MAEMKDSGVAWINTIPKEWKLKKIKYALKNRNENNNPIRSKNILSLTAKQGVIPLEEKEGGGNKPKEDYSAYKLAYPNDIVMNSMNVLSGSVGLSKYFGCVSPVYYMLRPIDEKDDVRYYNYIFQTTVFQRSLLGLGNGILMKESDNGKLNTIRMRIPLDKLGNLLIPVPDSSIQRKIADYLDSIIPNIDMLLADIEKQIETLEEYKKSIITEAVTKGLDPDVEMKDSGIDYIKTYPSTWTLKRLKYTFTERNERSITGEEELLSVSQYKGVIPSFQNSMRTMQASSLIGYKKVYIDDLVFNKLNPVLARFGRSEYNGITSPDYAVYIINHEYFLTKFLEYILRTDRYSKEYGRVTLGVGDGYTRLYTNQLGCFYVAAPSVDEQEKIILFLKNKVDEIDRVIKDKAKQLETLEQYKKSVIYEYVTGKKEVPIE